MEYNNDSDSRDNSFRNGFKNAAKEFKKHAKEFIDTYKSMYESLRDEEVESMRDGVRDQDSALDDRLKAIKRFFKTISRVVSSNFKDFSKAFKNTLETGTKNVFKNFDKSVKKSMEGLKDSGSDAADDVGDKFKGLSDTLGKLSIASDLGDVKGDLEDSVKSNLELRQELQRIAGVNDKAFSQMNKSAKQFSQSTGNKISSNEYLNSVVDIMKGTGIRDTNLATNYANNVVKGSKALDVSTDSYNNIIESMQKLNMDPKYLSTLNNQLMGVGQTYEVDPSKVLELVNENSEDIRDRSGGDQKKYESMMNDYTATVSALSDGWGDAGKMTDILKEIKDASPQDLGDLSQKYAGLDVMGVQKMMQNGNFSDAATTMIEQIGKAVSNPSMANYWKNIMGDSFTDFKNIYQTQGASGFQQEVGNVKKTMADSVNKDLVQKYSDEMVVGWFQRVKNYISSSTIGTGISNTLGSLGMDTGDLLMMASVFTGSKIGGKLLGKAGKFIGGKIFGAGVADAAGAGATGSVGSTVGSAIGSGLTGIAGGLGSTATGLGAAAVGGGAVAGGVSGALGAFSGIKDLVTAHNEDSDDKKKEKYFQGGSKLAMVGGGAAAGAAIGSIVPVIGTAAGGLIGAGIGGIGALLKGDDVGSALSGVKDSKDDLDNTTDAIKADMSYKDMQKSYKPMKDEFDKSLDDMSKSYSKFSKNIENNPPTVTAQEGGGSSTSSSSGSTGTASKFKWWNPFTWFSSSSNDTSDDHIDGSHKDGLDRVPFDGYRAELHKDEAVLTASQAKEWRNNQAAESATNFLTSTFLNLKDSIGNLNLSSALPGGSSSASSSVSNGGNDDDSSFKDSGAQVSQVAGNPKKFIAAVVPGAVQAYKKYNILPSLTLAQAILESGWGKSAIGNNLFGIKAFSDWKGKKKKVWTTEYNSNGSPYKIQAWFRDYDSIDGSILDHSKLLTTSRYDKVRKATNYKQATQAVRDAGYATDPNYPQLLNQLIEQNNLNKYDDKSKMNAYAQGTPWVPNDQVALIHQNEMVVPKDKNPLVNNSVSIPLGTSNDNTDKLIQLVEWGFKKLISVTEKSSQPSQPVQRKQPAESKSAQVFSFSS